MNEPRVIESVTNECQSLGRAHESSSARAEQLIACLEGEIAKRDEELAACRVAVENCELFRARIAEFEARYQRDVYGLNNEGDPIGGDPAGGYANDNARLRSELAAIKAQEPVAYIPVDRETGEEWHPVLKKGSGNICDYKPLYAAPVSEAKAQGVAMPPSPYMPGVESAQLSDYERGEAQGRCDMWSEVARLKAAPSAPAADAGCVLEQAMYTLISIGYHENSGLVHELRQALAAHRAKGVV